MISLDSGWEKRRIGLNTYLIVEDDQHPSNTSQDHVAGKLDNLQPSVPELQSLQSSMCNFGGAEVVSPFRFLTAIKICL